jgi:hypothetical protein
MERGSIVRVTSKTGLAFTLVNLAADEDRGLVDVKGALGQETSST